MYDMHHAQPFQLLEYQIWCGGGLILYSREIGLCAPRRCEHHTCVVHYTSVVSGMRKTCARSCAPQTPHMCDFSHICGVWVAQEALEAEYPQ